MSQTVATPGGSVQTSDKSAIRRFPDVNVPDAELTESRRRIEPPSGLNDAA
jgi:hypothetical protein